MKRYLYGLWVVSTLLLIFSCSKDTAGAETALAQQFIQDKTWYLDYSIVSSASGEKTKSYVGQSTYFINFLSNGSTKDSDGISGSYTIEKTNNQLQIHVQAKTSAANSVAFIYNLETVGAQNLVLFYQTNNQLTKLYYSAK